ncbi:branched-chain amino acid aminotransferase [Kineobactrum salinum]|uniref:Branched-chain-amino-acid aminotransferase n=1 Tax=Kineobactrum salinum TaxID=2708301 RepID=A0A6C0TXW9_9GAMM|nr:branched-chain amino acid aminotransferase [Kineobactrum salinum]QIB64616.1 branched-chain amino acid aminotransferase [Kineobactrum salinum]
MTQPVPDHGIQDTGFQLQDGLDEAIAAFCLPEVLGFGSVFGPAMFRADYRDGQWLPGEFQRYGPIALEPGAKVLHYAQEVFEGLKAYRVDGREAALFRPEMNWRRLNSSAARLCLPAVPESVYVDGVFGVTALNEAFIPGASGESLYLRPFLFGTESNLGMGVAREVSFMVIASPSQAYHPGSMSLLIERGESRVAGGGIGAAKVGGNYACALQSAARCAELGYDLTLWLDPVKRRDIEELSGMNFFAVVDGRLLTPTLTGSILAGITRDSVIQLARSRGLEVEETSIAVDELLEWIAQGRCSECFACGTAAIIAPIRELGEADGRRCQLPPEGGAITASLRQALLDIQEGRAEDTFGWMAAIPDRYRRSSMSL